LPNVHCLGSREAQAQEVLVQEVYSQSKNGEVSMERKTGDTFIRKVVFLAYKKLKISLILPMLSSQSGKKPHQFGGTASTLAFSLYPTTVLDSKLTFS
jgi:hypothetical protein